jgi:malate dehydrogenase (oxaloacetate-decarboxylating)(NADP+)
MSQSDSKYTNEQRPFTPAAAPSSEAYYARDTRVNMNRADIPWVRSIAFGYQLLRNSAYNKGLAFTAAERRVMHLEGLLPPTEVSQDVQAARAMANVKRASSDVAKYLYLNGLAERNERLFFRVLIDNVVELMPIVYTPTIGQICKMFGDLYRATQGIYITLNDRGNIHNLLHNWPQKHIRGIVFTDGERILGLGDLGSYGMGIPIGKLRLYTACGGVDPRYLLPVTIDVGTNNEELLEDQFYTGLRAKRDTSEAYDELIDEFITAVKGHFGPYTLLQFEDFANRNASRLLQKYKDACCCFNDDIQGTASVVVAGIYGSLKISDMKLDQHTFLFYGAGSAGIGIADLIVDALMTDCGLERKEARARVFLVDSRGLITQDRPSGGVKGEKIRYAHEFKHMDGSDLAAIVRATKATAIIGVAAQPAVFTEDVCVAMTENTEYPLIFPLSNPTSKAECTAEDAYKWTNGKLVFASGSPFDDVHLNDRAYKISQGNNSYIFPGVALAVISVGARRVPNHLFLIAAKALAEQVTDEIAAEGRIYPPLETIRQVSLGIAVEVAREIYNMELATFVPQPANLREFLQSRMYDGAYPVFVSDNSFLGQTPQTN